MKSNVSNHFLENQNLNNHCLEKLKVSTKRLPDANWIHSDGWIIRRGSLALLWTFVMQKMDRAAQPSFGLSGWIPNLYMAWLLDVSGHVGPLRLKFNWEVNQYKIKAQWLADRLTQELNYGYWSSKKTCHAVIALNDVYIFLIKGY